MWALKHSKKPSDSALSKARASLVQLKNREDLGFFRTELMQKSKQDCLSQSGFLKGKKHLVVIGLGGSSLGSKALSAMLKPFEWNQKLTFLDNVDSRTLEHFLENLKEPQNVGWVLCSKSGGTIEVTTLYEACENWLSAKHNFSIVQNTLVVTEDKKSPIFNFAMENKCPLLFMPKNVGGRFSVFTCIGLIPLLYLGSNLEELLAGYEEAMGDDQTCVELAARLFELQQEGYHSFYSFQYADSMVPWGLWLQQLWSESLGKKHNRSGGEAPLNPVFIPCRGASDQHSVLQQIMEGAEKKTVCFHRVESCESQSFSIENPLFENSLMKGRSPGELLRVEAEATNQALTEAGVPTLVLKTQTLNEKSASRLMGLWMLVTGILGEMYDIDAFNQPGVESGKIIARRVLSQPD